MRWLDDVSMDLKKMGVNEWRERARNREAWRHTVGRPRPTPGCSAIWRRRIISDVLIEVSMFQHHTKLCSQCSTLLVSYLNLSLICWAKTACILLNAAFAMAILDLISHVNLASFVITLSKYLKYCAF